MNVADEMPASEPAETSSSSTSKPAALGPAQVHAQQHVGPVLGVGAALARLDLADGVVLVVLAGEQAAQLELVEVGAERRRARRSISAADRVVVLLAGQLGERLGVVDALGRARRSSSRSSVDRRQLAGDLRGPRRRRPTGRGATPRSRAGAAGPAARRSSGSPRASARRLRSAARSSVKSRIGRRSRSARRGSA